MYITDIEYYINDNEIVKEFCWLKDIEYISLTVEYARNSIIFNYNSISYEITLVNIVVDGIVTKTGVYRLTDKQKLSIVNNYLEDEYLIAMCEDNYNANYSY